MLPSIAFIGAGPTTVYALHALLDAATQPFAVTVYEEQVVAGRGSPYRPGWNDPAMLSNIASIEIPPIQQSLIEWLEAQPMDWLQLLGVDPTVLDERAFYPRVAIGAFFRDQFEGLIARARADGMSVTVRTRSRVEDAEADGDQFVLTVRTASGAVYLARHDFAVVATGHCWPAEPETRPGHFLCPWPASALAGIPGGRIGILGTSLSGIDAAVALANRFGAFVSDDDGYLTYEARPDMAEFHITMMSRKGLLPEADFYHPIPYEPLSICTSESVGRLVEAGDDALLDRTFELFKRELAAADPDYAERVGLEALDLEGFCEGYFAQRAATDAFAWAERNLIEAQRNFATATTVPWRYAILRMHEVIAEIVPDLGDEDFERFTRLFKPVFVDDYATVPHLSIQRMLALRKAGHLELLALKGDYEVSADGCDRGVRVIAGGKNLHFPTFVEATGQRSLGVDRFPLPSLREQGVVRDVGSPSIRGVEIDESFRPVASIEVAQRLFCLSLPFILGQRPFAQGITSSYDMGRSVGQSLASAIGRERWARPASDRHLEDVTA